MATYWIKLKPLVFGVHVQDPDPETRQKIGSNKGVVVYAVIKGSPAFYADILKGDVLQKVGNVEVYDAKLFQETIARYAGQKITFEILRDGKEIYKEIQLNQPN